MINKKALSDDLVRYLSVNQYLNDNDIPDDTYIRRESIPELAREEFRNNPLFHSEVCSALAQIMVLIDNNTESVSMNNVEADAARYRHLRQSWSKRYRNNKLEWYLPHFLRPEKTTGTRLDESIDSEISYKARQR